MIRAVSWFAKTTSGVLVSEAAAWRSHSPAPATTESLLALLPRPVKYFSRMPPEAQLCLCAATLAMRETHWLGQNREVGLLTAGFDGTLAADGQYFTDYVASGRKLGRANLFVYTLPTSAASAVCIAIGLTGPAIHLQAHPFSLASLIRQARQMVADGEAAGMLALWSDPRAAVCLAIDAADGTDLLPPANAGAPESPLQLAETLARMVPRP
jgi:3-oxoacyl-(acyl-carrier-protein) synthase